MKLQDCKPGKYKVTNVVCNMSEELIELISYDIFLKVKRGTRRKICFIAGGIGYTYTYVSTSQTGLAYITNDQTDKRV